MLYKFIRQQRKKKGLTQELLAKELNVSRPTYIQIENGEREFTLSEAQKLASIFNISIENFLSEEEFKVSIKIKKKKTKQSNTLQIRITEENLEKFQQVLLYILNKVGGKPNVGETVLHKLLYFIDFDYFEKYEENLMGTEYIKNHHGPTSVLLQSMIDQMEKKGDLETVKSQYFKYKQKKYLARKQPNLDILSAREIEHIDNVLARLSDKNALEIERYSHGDIPWKSAKNGEILSYESVFYRDEKYSVRSYEDPI